MNLKNNIEHFQNLAKDNGIKLIAVTKTKPVEMIREAYDIGLKTFGENRAQELADKHKDLPDDIEWHMIGHLQRNKVKYIAQFVHLIHSADSVRLLREINKQAKKSNRTIHCLLQVHIAEEEQKFGFVEDELNEMFSNKIPEELENVAIDGLMGMATFTDNENIIRKEFRGLKQLFDKLKSEFTISNVNMKELSMGMSGDYQIAIEEGSTMIRVGSLIFGPRNNDYS